MTTTHPRYCRSQPHPKYLCAQPHPRYLRSQPHPRYKRTFPLSLTPGISASSPITAAVAVYELFLCRDLSLQESSGRISYELLVGEDDASDYFVISPTTGVVMVASSLANDPQQRLTFMVRLQHNFFYIVGAISRAPNAKFQFSDSEDRVQFWVA